MKTNCYKLMLRMNDLNNEAKAIAEDRYITNYNRLDEIDKEFLAIKHFLEANEVNFGTAQIERYSKGLV